MWSVDPGLVHPLAFPRRPVLLLAALVVALGDPTPARAAAAGLPEREPAAVGMSAARLGTIERVVQRGLDAGGYPGASVVVGASVEGVVVDSAVVAVATVVEDGAGAAPDQEARNGGR